METQDLAFPLLRNIEVCTRLEDGIRDASAVIFLEDEDSPEAEESRDEFLRNNAERFCNYAKVLDEAALPIVKVKGFTPSNRCSLFSFVVSQQTETDLKLNYTAKFVCWQEEKYCMI